MNANFELVSYVLSIIPLAKSHTWVNVTESVAQRIMEATKDSSLLVSSVTDNGANFVKMSRSLMNNMLIAVAEDQDIDDWSVPLPEDAIDDDLSGRTIGDVVFLD